MSVSVILLVLLSAALHAMWNGLIKGGTDPYLDTAGLLLGSVFLAIVIMPFLPFPARASWPYLAASGIIHLAYFSLIAACYHKGDMSVVYPIMRGTAPALTAIGSAFALHEHPSQRGWAGVILISAGVVMFAFDKRNRDGIHLKPIALALANAAIIALYTLVDGTGVRLSHSPLSYTFCGVVLCSMGFIPIAVILRRRQVADHMGKEWRRGLIGGGCSIAAYSMALWAMTKSHIATVAALREVAILFGFVIAVFKLKERATMVRILACLLIVSGAIVIKFS